MTIIEALDFYQLNLTVARQESAQKVKNLFFV